MTSRHFAALAMTAVGFVWLHALTVPRTLGDMDSVNLAFGVESFSVAHHAPHPPGYPVYIALGKLSTAAVGRLQPDLTRGRRAAAGLAWLSILAGGLGVFALAALWRALGISPLWSTLAAIGTAAAPLYWFTAARPLTDMPGAVAAIAIQAALLHGLRRLPTQSTLPRSLLVGSLAAGLAIGLRSQTMWLTLPLLAWVLGRLVQHRKWRHAAALSGACVAGVLIWFIPLVQLSGGLDEYRSALRGQGRADFSSVEMLATHPSWARLRDDLVQTFLWPWRLTRLPWVILAAAGLGLVKLAANRRSLAELLVLLVLPYLAFHVLFHEVETIRYALPIVAVMAGLAIIGLSHLGTRAGGTAAMAVAGAWLAIVHPVTAVYASGSPVFRVIKDMRAALEETDQQPRLEAHQAAWWATSRALGWSRTQWTLNEPRLVDRDESLRLVDYWRSGATTPIWFLSDPSRGDLARFDPHATRHERTYRLPPDVASLIAGLRQFDVGWWRLSQPDWMLGRGWSVNREMAHESGSTNRAVAFLRRHSGETMLFIGARQVQPAGTPVTVTATLDGVAVDSWSVPPDERLTRWITLPPGTLHGDGAYATLALSVVSSQADGPARLVAFEEFDAALTPAPLIAPGRGWSAVEDNGRTRRASRLSELEVRHAGRPVRVTIRGDAGGTGTAGSPTVVIFAGATLLARFVPDQAFEQTFEVAPNQLEAAGGTIQIAVSRNQTPDDRARRVRPPEFGLRVNSIDIADAGAR